jgi:hypothetical protein
VSAAATADPADIVELEIFRIEQNHSRISKNRI